MCEFPATTTPLDSHHISSRDIFKLGNISQIFWTLFPISVTVVVVHSNKKTSSYLFSLCLSFKRISNLALVFLQWHSWVLCCLEYPWFSRGLRSLNQMSQIFSLRWPNSKDLDAQLPLFSMRVLSLGTLDPYKYWNLKPLAKNLRLFLSHW